MALVLTVALGAFLVGRLAGGTLPRLLSVRLRSPRLLVVTVALQAAGGLVALLVGPAYGVATALSGIFVAAFGLRNRGVPGAPLVSLGLLLNVVVVVLNGAMPVSTEAARAAGVRQAASGLADDARREVLTGRTRLGLLGARIPVALPPHREVATPGNLLVAAGVALYVVTGMNQPRPRTSHDGSRTGATAAGSPDGRATYATMEHSNA